MSYWGLNYDPQHVCVNVCRDLINTQAHNVMKVCSFNTYINLLCLSRIRTVP